jgi:hypothetical protein
VFVVDLESVCRPGDVPVGPDQERARLNIGGLADHDIEAVGPSGCGTTHAFAGQIQQYRAAVVKQLADATAVVQAYSRTLLVQITVPSGNCSPRQSPKSRTGGVTDWLNYTSPGRG